MQTFNKKENRLSKSTRFLLNATRVFNLSYSFKSYMLITENNLRQSIQVENCRPSRHFGGVQTRFLPLGTLPSIFFDSASIVHLPRFRLPYLHAARSSRALRRLSIGYRRYFGSGFAYWDVTRLQSAPLNFLHAHVWLLLNFR